MNKLPILILTLLLITFATATIIEKEVTNSLNTQEKISVIVEKNLEYSNLKIQNEIPIKKITENEEKFTAIISKEELQILSKDPTIKKIRPNILLTIFMGDSVGITEANETWNLQINNSNLTGLGQSVCILDTGINNTHPDLLGKILAEKCFCSVSDSGSGGCCPDTTNEDDNATDDHGHGTHVAGIIGANGDLKGIATNTTFVIVKIMNATGSGNSNDLENAFQWCLDNANTYNITVISASLGSATKFTSENQTECDETSSFLTSKINTAFANNISVTIATGNDGWNDGITWPACISNATPVGNANKDNTIYSGGNRNSFVKLLGIGVSINSTKYTGGYETRTGTSMATPMVAGAIAIINQFLNLTGQTKTPAEIETTLYETGQTITEGENNYSRINIYEAILSLDNIEPTVNLTYPSDNTINTSTSHNFSCNATDWQLANTTIKIWNSTGLFYNQTSNLTGASNQTTFEITNLSQGNYTWNCLTTDTQGNSAYAISNFTLIVGGISVTLSSPTTATYTATNTTNFSCSAISASSNELSNLTFYLWSSTELIYNETESISGTTNSSNFSYTFTEEENYKWNCEAFNNNSESTLATSNNTITYDITNPVITLGTLPTDETSNSANKHFYFDVTEENIDYCNLIINGDISSTKTSIDTEETQTFTETFEPGNYEWKIECVDLAGNSNSTIINEVIITEEAWTPSSSSSSSGGGSESFSTTSSTTETETTTEIGSTQISKGYSKKMKKDEKIKFNLYDIQGQSHTLTIKEIGTDYADITIQSDPINFKLGIGQSIKLNLTSEKYYDLLIVLNEIIDESADLTIQLISESINQSVIEVEKEKLIEKTIIDKKYYLVIIAAALIIILALIIFLKMTRLKRLERKIKRLEKKSEKLDKKKTRNKDDKKT